VKKAWLITWECVGKHSERKDGEVASILNYRLSEKTIAKYMEQLYADSYYNFRERLAYAKNKKDNPCRAKYDKIDGVDWTGRIYCDCNPLLEARLVENIHVEVDSDGNELLKWDEIPHPKPKQKKDER